MGMSLSLFENAVESTSHRPYEHIFRQLYYDLYSNSDASRADRIFEDIAKLLLVKALVEIGDDSCIIDSFLNNGGTANEILLPELHKHFPEMVDQAESFIIGDVAIKSALNTLSNIDICNSPSSILGDAFQALIGPRIRGDKGQFFTPRTLVSAMVNIASPKPTDKIVDPAAGTGGFIVAAHTFRTERWGRQVYGQIVGIDKDRDLYRLGGAMVALATQGVGHYHCANSLDLEALSQIKDYSPFGADIVLTNPPFGSRISISDTKILGQFQLGHNWTYSESDHRWIKMRSLRSTQDPQILFIELCLRLLKPGGLLGIVLPEGIFGNKQSGYIWDYIRQNGCVKALLDCPRTTFQPGTDTKTNVVFIEKITDDLPRVNTVKVAVAKFCGHDRRGRSKNNSGTPLRDDFSTIAESYSDGDNSLWCECELTDPYYLVPRYYYNSAHSRDVCSNTLFTSEVYSIGEMIAAKYIVVRKGHEVSAEAYGTGEIPFVRTSDIHNWEVSLNTTNGVSEDIYQKYKRLQNIKPLDILLVVDGRYKIGRTAILHRDDCECVVQSHIRIITVSKTSPISPFELLYIMNTPFVLEQMRNLTFIQSTLGSLGKRLDQLIIPIPNKSAEWNDRVNEFECSLKKRAEILNTLRKWENPEPEL